MPTTVRYQPRSLRVETAEDREIVEFLSDRSISNRWLRNAPAYVLRKHWVRFGDAILRERAAGLKHGTRPHVWWLVAAPERRRLLSGRVRFEDDTYFYGVPAAVRRDGSEPLVYESESAFLIRHNLLLDGEQPAENEPLCVPDEL